MENITSWAELLLNSLQTFGNNLMAAIPNIIGAILIVLVGWLVARLLTSGLSRLLKVAKFDQLSDKIKFSEFLEKANVSMSPSKLIGKFIYWILMLLVIIAASDAMGWEAVSFEISKLLGYLPNLLVAIIIFAAGAYIAMFVRDLIKGATGSLGISSGKVISTVVYYLLLIVVILTALSQAGVDTTIITANLLIIIGAVLATAAISYGFASKDILANILASFFSRRTFKVGMEIEVNGIRGKIVSVDNISVTILNNQGEKEIIPSHMLVTNKVKVIE